VTDDTGELDARKPARPVRGRGVEKVPPSNGNSSASYPTRPTFGRQKAGSTRRWPAGGSTSLVPLASVPLLPVGM